MKKILTIVALALVLCLGVSAMLAESQRKEYGTTFGTPFYDGAADLLSAVEASIAGKATIGGIQVREDIFNVREDLAEAKANAVHGEYSTITLWGTKLKEKKIETYTLGTEQGIAGSHTVYEVDAEATAKDEEGKTHYKEVKNPIFDSTTLGKYYDKSVDYEYTEEGYEEVAVKVMLAPHDKLGGKEETTKDGKKVVIWTCSCGKEWDPEDPIDPKTCKHEFAWVAVKGAEPNCLVGGKEIETCIICGTTKGEAREVGPTGAHKWEYDLATLCEPVCIEAPLTEMGWKLTTGYVYRQCSVCHKREKQTFETEGQYLNFLVNGLGFTWAEADEWDPHDWSATIIDPATCDDVAHYMRICKRCHVEEHVGGVPGSRSLEANYVVQSVPNCKALKAGDVITFKCSKCGSASRNHPVLTYTITEDDVKELKGNEFIRVEGKGKAFYFYWNNETRRDEVVQYEVTGETYIYHTGALKETDAKKQYVVRNGAEVAGLKVADATCGDEIWNKFTCATCEEKAIAKKISTVEHKWGEWKLYKNYEDTKVWKRVCARCAEEETAYSNVSPDKKCKEGEHNYVPQGTWVNCRDYRRPNPGLAPVLGVKDAIETDLVCTICGDKTTGWYTIEHDWQLLAELSKEATCEESGMNVYQCTVCKQYAVEELALADHELVKTEKVPATCVATGTEEYYTCTVCGKMFEDEDGWFEIDEPVEIAIDKKAHKWDEGKVTTEPTTEKAGVKTFTCLLCNETKTEEIPKLIPAAKYTLTNVAYDGMAVSGKVAHVDGTKELDKVYVRVTFFYTDGTYAVFVVPVEDGEFYAGATTACAHIAVQVVDNNKQVAPPKTDAIYGNANAKMEDK